MGGKQSKKPVSLEDEVQVKKKVKPEKNASHLTYSKILPWVKTFMLDSSSHYTMSAEQDRTPELNLQNESDRKKLYSDASKRAEELNVYPEHIIILLTRSLCDFKDKRRVFSDFGHLAQAFEPCFEEPYFVSNLEQFIMDIIYLLSESSFCLVKYGEYRTL